MAYSLQPGDRHLDSDGSKTTVSITEQVKRVDNNTYRIDLQIEYRGGFRKCHIFVPDFVARQYRGKPGTYRLDIIWQSNTPVGVTFPGYVNQREKLIVCKLHAS